MFVDQVLGNTAGHFYDWSPLCHEYWESDPLDDRQLAQFFAAIQPSHLAVMVSAKARMDPSRYRHHLKPYPADSTASASDAPLVGFSALDAPVRA